MTQPFETYLFPVVMSRVLPIRPGVIPGRFFCHNKTLAEKKKRSGKTGPFGCCLDENV